ncbi:hypothetical protein KSS87_013644 [Heliosperma pusillum]|nr:hypothetical protein KSS87_013644 [Heliosperma pusillum]
MRNTSRIVLCYHDPSKKPKQIVDVGCGIGGSSRYLAKKYGAKCQGITLSPFQAERAQALAAAEGLADKASFQVADALEQPFADGQFDLVWSMESGEHMPDKKKFVTELARVAAPGATIIIVTWCHRDLSPSEKSLRPDEIQLLNKICDAYYLPAWCSTADYVQLLESLSLKDIKSADWSEYVAPFWPAVIRSALTWKGLTSLLRSGWKTIKGALAMPLMIEGYKKDLIRLIAEDKPTDLRSNLRLTGRLRRDFPNDRTEEFYLQAGITEIFASRIAETYVTSPQCSLETKGTVATTLVGGRRLGTTDARGGGSRRRGKLEEGGAGGDEKKEKTKGDDKKRRGGSGRPEGGRRWEGDTEERRKMGDARGRGQESWQHEEGERERRRKRKEGKRMKEGRDAGGRGEGRQRGVALGAVTGGGVGVAGVQLGVLGFG